MDRISIRIESLDEFESQLGRLNCLVTSKGTLRSFPGCIHWHIKMRDQKSGTIELTVLPSGETWIVVHKNRYQPWIDEVIAQIT